MVKIKKYIVRASVNFSLLDGHELLHVYEYIPSGTIQQGRYKKIELTNLINNWVNSLSLSLVCVFISQKK